MFLKISNLFNFNEEYNFISYQKIMESKYDLFQFNYIIKTKIKIIY